jgi:hypothetical protein
MVFNGHIASHCTHRFGDLSHSSVSQPRLFPAELAHWMRMRTFLWIDVGIEWGLVGAAAFLLGRFDHADLIPQVVGVVVGLHFLPLAKIFHAPRLYWTGSIIVVGALGTLLIPHGAGRNSAACVSVGLTLWVTCVVILFRISSASDGQTTLISSGTY